MNKSLIKEPVNEVDFQARIVILDNDIKELDIFVWELEPLDSGRRSDRDWVWEHMFCAIYDIAEFFKVSNEGAWEIVFEGNLSGSYCPCGEWDEDLEISESLTQQLPDDWFQDDIITLTQIEETE